jgi:hypothetical protein
MGKLFFWDLTYSLRMNRASSLNRIIMNPTKLPFQNVQSCFTFCIADFVNHSCRMWLYLDEEYFYTMYFPWNCITFTKNQNHFVAQDSFLFVLRSQTCIGQIYWPSSGSLMQECFNSELARVVTTVVFKFLKLLKWGCSYNTVEM